MLMVLLSAITANAKCDWSSLKLQQWNERNDYKWYVSGQVLDDTCVDYMFTVYDFQTKKTDTIQDIRGIVEVQFNVKGKYKLILKVSNRCEKNCETTLYRPVEIITFPSAGLGWTSDTISCKKYKFEMNYIKNRPAKDTCMEYYLMFYKGPWMDTMSQKEWDNLTDYQIGMEYDFPDDDFLGYTTTRLAEFTFKDSGRVLMVAQWWNKCIRQDTFMFRRLDVCKTETSKVKVPTPLTSGIKVAPNPADDKVIFTVASTNKVVSNIYEIYNSKGKLVMSGKMGASISVGVSNLPNGVYVVKIGKLSQKFVVQH